MKVGHQVEPQWLLLEISSSMVYRWFSEQCWSGVRCVTVSSSVANQRITINNFFVSVLASASSVFTQNANCKFCKVWNTFFPMNLVKIRISNSHEGDDFFCFVIVDHTTCDSCADSTSSHSWCCGSNAVLQIQTVLQGTSRTFYLHWWELLSLRKLKNLAILL